MAKKLKEQDIIQSPDEQKKELELTLKTLQQKKADFNAGIQKSQSMATNAKKLASLPSGLTDRAKSFDQKMNNDGGQKNTEEARYNREQMKKVDQEIQDVNSRMSDLQNNKPVVTKEQILRMVESEEPARMKKKDLIESISNLILTEDMNDDLKDKLESGDNDYAKHLDPETVKRMADDIMDDVKANLQAKMGRGTRMNLENATRTLAQGLQNALEKERRHRPQLEQLAVQMVSDEYGIPEGAVEFDARITGEEPIRKTGLKMKKGNKRPPQGKTEEELKPNITKRRLMNAMMHGAARKGQYMYHMAQTDLNRIAPGLTDDYSKIMAGNDFMYWAMDDETISNESEEGTHAGQVRVDLSGEKPKIIAQGMTFPFLLHELTKGVLELMSLHGLDVDKETRDYVLDKTDNLESEPWDIRLGPKIWEKFMEALSVDDLPNKSQIFNKLSTLPPAEFNGILQGLMNDTEQARRAIRDIASDVRRELGEESLDQATSQFRDSGDDEGPTPPPDEDDEDPVLKGLLGGKDKPEEQPEVEEIDNPEDWSERELKSGIDDALDSGDYDTVRMLTDILNKKY
jgi:hypothetical protein